MALLPGMRLGPYEIVAPIGAGGMGEVYRALDTRLNREVAVKILPQAFAHDPDRLRRFYQEAQAAGSLNHPNIVAVYDVGQSDGAAYVVTELLEGATLRERISGAAMPVRKAVDCAVQAARGLAAAHARGIMHRDIKPENLFLTRDGFVKILDFGLAKVVSARAANATSAPTAALETSAGVVLGTAGYMAPEQVRGVTSDHRCDLFSLGAVLYEMLSGRRAFGGSSPADAMSAILKDEPSDLPANVPGALGAVVRRCLEKAPEERFESARDLAFALETVSTVSTSGNAVSLPRPPRFNWRHLAVAALILALPAAAWILARGTASAAIPHFQQVTFRRGLISSARFASDGKEIVYSAAWDGKQEEVFSTMETSPESRRLGNTNAQVAAVSRTGEMALILRPQPGVWLVPVSGTLARAPLSGGAPREVAEHVLFADWSPDASALAVVREVPGGQVLEYPLGRKLYESPGAIFMPKVSPKGDLVAFLDAPLTWDQSGTLSVVDAAGKKRALTRRFWGINGLGWSADGSKIWFAGIESGIATDLDVVDMKGNLRVVQHLPGEFELLDVSPDGRALLMHDSFRASLYFRAAGAKQEADLYWHDNSVIRDITPDGSRILFSEGGAASTTDWISYLRTADGSPAVRLGEGLGTALSPDGKWAMTNPTGVQAPLMAYPTRAGSARTLTSDSIRHLGGRWLADGQRFIFVGAEGTHKRYYVQDSNGGAPKAISGEDFEFDRSDDIVLSPDTRTVAIRTGHGIQLLPADGGDVRSVPGDTAAFMPIAWCRDNSLLMYRPGEIPAHILRTDLETGKQQPWKDLAPQDRTALGMVWPIRVAADCETYAYTAQYDLSTLFVVKGLR